MRKVVYVFGISLDGYIEGPDGQFDWTEPDEELHRYFNGLESRTGTHLYGRRLWELMSAFWPTAHEDMSNPEHIREFARYWQDAENVVVSRTLDHVAGGRVIRDNLWEEVEALKREPGLDIAVGGAELGKSLLQMGLVDEIHCVIHPVLIGGGKPMFGRLDELTWLNLLEVRQFNGGVVMLRYECKARGQETPGQPG